MNAVRLILILLVIAAGLKAASAALHVATAMQARAATVAMEVR